MTTHRIKDNAGRWHRVSKSTAKSGSYVSFYRGETINPYSGHREFVFSADRNPRTHCNSQTASMALKRMGFEGRLVSHGMRSMASTILNEQGWDPELIEVVLAHVDKDEVRSAYNRADYIERRRPMMTWWSEHIQHAATGSLSISAVQGTRGLKLISTR
ncbi:tyrosine-type recombinase/integrase [Pseudomonas fluorescens]|uniref:tyrosine-type recombinase/integrase n=1 Tax=Pseudomonas fluorescens TaxID=294 RepID=UPI003D7F5EA0